MPNITNQINESINQHYYCQLTIRGMSIIPRNIINLTVREWIFEPVPRIEIMLNDDGMLTELYTIEDGDIIDLLLAKHDQIPTDQMLKCKFQVQDFQSNMVADNSSTILYITGLLYTPEMYFPIKNRSFKKKSSKDVIHTIANECGLDFKPGQNFSTSDSMNWFQINQNNMDFINHIKERAYKANDCALCFANTSNELIYTSLYTETSKDSSKIARYDLNKYSFDDFETAEDKRVLWYNYVNFINLMGTYNKQSNYKVSYQYYDMTKKQEKDYSDTKHVFTDYSWKRFDRYNELVKHNNYGFLTKNTHNNYFLSQIQNEYLLKNFFGFALTINVNSLQKVKNLDIVNLIVPAMYKAGGDVNEIHSGKYLVAGIVHQIAKEGIYEKSLILCRDGFNASGIMKNYRSKA